MPDHSGTGTEARPAGLGFLGSVANACRLRVWSCQLVCTAPVQELARLDTHASNIRLPPRQARSAAAQITVVYEPPPPHQFAASTTQRPSEPQKCANRVLQA
jgi:hypothetical protein